jgi:hypothetical protein
MYRGNFGFWLSESHRIRFDEGLGWPWRLVFSGGTDPGDDRERQSDAIGKDHHGRSAQRASQGAEPNAMMQGRSTPKAHPTDDGRGKNHHGDLDDHGQDQPQPSRAGIEALDETHRGHLLRFSA